MTHQVRNVWLDIAKGITIVLMVLGHSAIPIMVSRFIFSFHMPLFFIASGWTTNWGREKYSVGSFCVHKIKTLLVPFLIYSAIVLIILGISHEYSILDWLKNGWQGYALWFIPVIFIALLIVKFIHTIRYEWIKIILIIIITLLGMCLKKYNISFPWTLSSIPYACMLIFLGSYLKKIQFIIDKPKWYICLLGFVIAATISYYWKLDMAWNNILPIIPLTIGAIAGSLMMFSLSSFIEKYLPKCGQIAQFIGKETFVIVAFSQLIIIELNKYFELNAITKYLLLISILFLIILIKNITKALLK